MIYFDHNATTPIDGRVLDAMVPYLNTFYGNPSALYRAGRVVHSAIETAREQVAASVGVSAAQVIFTSGGTEANNLALKTVSSDLAVAVSAVEHPSIIEPARKNRQKSSCYEISVDDCGLVFRNELNALLQHQNKPALVSIMLANNENGTIQDIESVAHLLTDKQVVLHTDAVQALGKIPVSFSQLGVDLMSLSSHKIYGPKGCGALIIDKDVAIEPLLLGGGQENGKRAGTENVAAIVGFGKAAELAWLELEQRTEHLLILRNTLQQGLKTIPELVIFAGQAKRIPNTVQFGIPGIDGEMLLMQLDQKNISVSSGSACSAGGGKASSVLTAMGIEYRLAKSAIRISLGQANTETEIKQFIEVLRSLV